MAGTLQPKPDEHGHERGAGKAYLTQQFIHNEGDARHVAAVFEHRKEKEQGNDGGQERKDAADAGKNTVDDERMDGRTDADGCQAVSAAWVTAVMPISSQSLRAAPITSKVSQKTVKMVNRKMGIAKYLWVR